MWGEERRGERCERVYEEECDSPVLRPTYPAPGQASTRRSSTSGAATDVPASAFGDVAGCSGESTESEAAIAERPSSAEGSAKRQVQSILPTPRFRHKEYRLGAEKASYGLILPARLTYLGPGKGTRAGAGTIGMWALVSGEVFTSTCEPTALWKGL
jgi:hypothetical protein